MQLIGRYGLFDAVYGWNDDRAKTFLVDRTLDRNMRQLKAPQTGGKTGRVELGILRDLFDWSGSLHNTAYYDLRKKLE